MFNMGHFSLFVLLIALGCKSNAVLNENAQPNLVKVLNEIRGNKEVLQERETANGLPKDDQAIWEQIGALYEALDGVEDEMEIQRQQINVLKEDVDKFDTGLKQVEAKTENHDSEIGALKVTNGDLSNQLNDVRTDISGIQNDIRDKNVAVGFSATTRSHLTYSQGQRLKFTTVLSNTGGHYNSGTGEFTCPYKGMYMFNLDILRGGANGKTRVRMYKGSTPLSGVFIHLGDGKDRHGSTMSVVTCNAGEKVWMQAEESDCKIFGYYELMYSFFGGILIRRLD